MFPLPPTLSKIWTKKAASCLYQELGHIKLPTSGKVHIDETFLFHNRHKIFWVARDPEHNLILALFFSRSRDTLAAYNFLRQLPAEGSGEGLIIVSGDLPAYRTVILLLFPNARHLVHIGFAHLPNNNAIKPPARLAKSSLARLLGAKSPDAGIVAFAINRTFIHNFFQPQEALDGKTPAEHAGVAVFRLASPWRSLMHYVFRASRLAAA